MPDDLVEFVVSCVGDCRLEIVPDELMEFVVSCVGDCILEIVPDELMEFVVSCVGDYRLEIVHDELVEFVVSCVGDCSPWRSCLMIWRTLSCQNMCSRSSRTHLSTPTTQPMALPCCGHRDLSTFGQAAHVVLSTCLW